MYASYENFCYVAKGQAATAEEKETKSYINI